MKKSRYRHRNATTENTKSGVGEGVRVKVGWLVLGAVIVVGELLAAIHQLRVKKTEVQQSSNLMHFCFLLSGFKAEQS
jgi:hypothetical protein